MSETLPGIRHWVSVAPSTVLDAPRKGKRQLDREYARNVAKIERILWARVTKRLPRMRRSRSRIARTR